MRTLGAHSYSVELSCDHSDINVESIYTANTVSGDHEFPQLVRWDFKTYILLFLSYSVLARLQARGIVASPSRKFGISKLDAWI